MIKKIITSEYLETKSIKKTAVPHYTKQIKEWKKMIKLKLTGYIKDIEGMIAIIEKDFIITSKSKPVKNRNSDFHRMYITVKFRGGLQWVLLVHLLF